MLKFPRERELGGDLGYPAFQLYLIFLNANGYGGRSSQFNMPRPKIIERRRCLKACDDCKIRKEKCDGLLPCIVCKKRNRETSCTYLTPRTGRGGSISQTAPSQAVMEQSALYYESDLTIESRSNGLGDINAEGETAAPNDANSPASAPVPKLSRLMRDGKGGLSEFPARSPVF